MQGISRDCHFGALAQLLLPLDLRKQDFLPILGAVDVSGPQLRYQAVALAAEQQQRVMAGRFEVPALGALLLLAVDRVSVKSMLSTTRCGESTASALPMSSRLIRARPAKFAASMAGFVSHPLGVVLRSVLIALKAA